MTKRIALLVAGLAAAGSFAVPASAAPAPPCTDQSVAECLRPTLETIKEFCVPSGDLEDDCQWGR